jgi:Protein of unknown function (DUF3224)
MRAHLSLSLLLPLLLLLPATAFTQSQGASLTNKTQGLTTMTQIAKGSFIVSMKPLTFDGADAETRNLAKLGRMSIDKQITGDLVATTKGEMLSAMTATKGSAGYVAIEYVTGSLQGKKGSFVFQHTGIMNRGTPTLAITVVPDSGTDELTGLEGTFKIDIVEGKHYYEFQYRLPQ